MTNDEQDRTIVGVLAVAVAVIAPLFSIATSVALGMWLGAQWGWTAAAAFLAIALVSVVRRIAAIARGDG